MRPPGPTPEDAPDLAANWAHAGAAMMTTAISAHANAPYATRPQAVDGIPRTVTLRTVHHQLDASRWINADPAAGFKMIRGHSKRGYSAATLRAGCTAAM